MIDFKVPIIEASWNFVYKYNRNIQESVCVDLYVTVH